MTKKETKAPEAKAEVKPAATAPAKGAKAATKKVEKAPKAAKVKVEKAPKVAKETKADKARAIYARLTGSARKDVVAAFQTEIGLSAAASATYFQNIKASLAKATA
jgi:hypothetical protein